MKSGLSTKRAWFGGVALLSALSVAACNDDDDRPGNTAGKAGSQNQGGEAGSPSGGYGSMGGKSGNDTGGTAGKSNNDAGMGGDEPSMTGGEGGLAGAGGEGGEPVTPLLQQVRAAFAGMSPLPAVPADPTNAHADDAAAAALGQRLFFDAKFSGPMTGTGDLNLGAVGESGKVSCVSCHSGAAMDDERSDPPNVSKGTGLHTRNSPAVVNSSFYTWTNWGGRFASQWELPLAVVESPAIMNGNRLQLAHRILDQYEADYEAVFGQIPAAVETMPAAGKPGVVEFDSLTDDEEAIVNRILVNYSKAIQAYMRKLVSRESPFDLMMAGADDALNDSELRGAMLFKNKGCTECHSGPTFSDQRFHDLGVAGVDLGRYPNTEQLLASKMNIDGVFSDKTDTGKLQTIPNPLPESWKGAFRTPSLRGVALTAPYMHAGQLATLSDVLDFYEIGVNANTGEGEPLSDISITVAEKADMIAFLGTLTGKPVDAALLTDTSDPD